MKILGLILLMVLSSCASEKKRFSKEKVCSQEALKYLKNPRNKHKSLQPSPSLIAGVASTASGMQLCYEEFKHRTGHHEFNTCLVVGVDEHGNTEFFNFASQEVKLDQSFMDCARTITAGIPYSQYGTNYILIQAYQFYVNSSF